MVKVKILNNVVYALSFRKKLMFFQKSFKFSFMQCSFAIIPAFILFCSVLASTTYAAIELPPIYVSPSGGIVSSEPIQKTPPYLIKSKKTIGESKVETEIESEPEPETPQKIAFSPDDQDENSVDEAPISEMTDTEPAEQLNFDVNRIIDPIAFDSGFFSFKNKDFTHTFEIGSESYFYKYEESSLDVTDTGEFNGMNASYTLSLSKNYNPLSFIDALKNCYGPTIFKIDGRFAWGYVDYKGTGTHDNIRNYVWEARGTAGYEIPITKNFNLVPYAGIGYRYLNDNFSSVPDKVINGVQFPSGYDRESRYAYIPVGLDFNKEIDEKWSLRLNLEYDYFLGGKQKSHFEDEKINGVNLGYDVHEVDQKDGYGAKVSVSILKKGERFNFFIKPFFNYWDIDESELEFLRSNGNLIPVDGCPGYYWAALEPSNTTKEYGLKIGAEF